MTDDPTPQLHIIPPHMAAVGAVCEAFGWPPATKGGHAAAWIKRTRTKLGLELVEFMALFVEHYGRVDPGAGTWWVYREVYPCKKEGDFPRPKLVEESWGRWELPVAVQMPAPSRLGSFAQKAWSKHE